MGKDDDAQIVNIADHPQNDFFRPGRFKSEGSREACERCGGPLVIRPLQPYPVRVQVVFGLNFLFLLIFFDQVQHPAIIWPWTALQIVLGLLLARGRKRARERVLRCVRCSADLP